MDKVIDTAFDWVGILFLAAVLSMVCIAPGIPDGVKTFLTLDVLLLALAASPD